MKFQVSFTVKQKEHLIEAIKAFWKSRNFQDISNTSTEVLLVRGQKGYKWIAINPLKYYFGLKCSITQNSENVVIICDAATEGDITKNTFRDALIKSEFSQFEKYINAFSENRPFNLKNISHVKLKTVWPQYVLNLFFPGLDLFFSGSANGYLLGGLTVVYVILETIQSFLKGAVTPSETFEPLSIFSYLFFYLLVASIGAILVVLSNYEKIYEFDND